MTYIQSAAQRQPPVLELWRSQTIAIQPLNELVENGRPSFCVKMPTGSGKTRIAELAILRSILDTGLTSDRKCLYIAPFRSLAVQIEASLRESFSPFGIHVSELYGGFELNPAEQILFDRTRILIATPEKMDALLRFDPKLAQNIELIIVDEGHIIDGGNRGLAYELFLHRLIRRFGNRGKRLLFLSAVIQNIDDFTIWITGNSRDEGLIESQWSISEPWLGLLRWDGTEGHVHFTHKGFRAIQPLPPPHRFFTAIPKDEIQLIKTEKPKRTVFPRKGNRAEIIALAGITAAKDGTTLIFTARPEWVDTIATAVLEALSLQKAIVRHKGLSAENLPIPSDSKSIARWKACIRFAEETAGPHSLVANALRKGIIIHHGNIPKGLRVKLEQLARDGIINLVISTNTLAQGVNLPVRTIFIHSLYRRQTQPIPATDFWNICGRAGRPLEENQGFVLILADETSPPKYGTAEQFARKTLNTYVKQAQTQRLESALKKFLESIVHLWSRLYPGASLAELCQHLADNEIDWLTEKERRQLDVVDKHLIALLEERSQTIDEFLNLLENQCYDATDPKVVQEIFERSLLFLQLPPSSPETTLSLQTAIHLLTARIQYITQIPESKRKGFYRTGLSLSACQYLEEHQGDIEVKLSLAKDYMLWNAEEQCDYIVNLCGEILFHLSDVKPEKLEKLPGCWLHILKYWLMGETAESIFQRVKTTENGVEDTSQVSWVIDKMCDFRLPMGFNALYAFFDTEGLPEVVPYMSSMIKYGVHSPVATILMSAGLENRQAALVCAEHYTEALDPSLVYTWIYELTDDDVSRWYADPQVTASVFTFLKRRREKEFFIEEDGFEPLYSCSIQTSANYISPLSVGMRLLMRSEPPNRIKLYTPAIEHLVNLRVNNAHFFERIESGRVHAIIEDIRASKNGHQEIDVRFE